MAASTATAAPPGSTLGRDGALGRIRRLTWRLAAAATAGTLLLMAGFANLLPIHFTHSSSGTSSGSGSSSTGSGTSGSSNSSSGGLQGSQNAPSSGSGSSQVRSGGS